MALQETTEQGLRAGPALAAIALTLAGCATFPPEATDHPSLVSPESLVSTQAIPGTHAEWPSDHWWEGFGDVQLTSLIEEGLTGATTIHIAQARFAQADALTGQVHSRLLPAFTASANGGVTKQSYNYVIPAAVVPQGWPDYGQATANLSWDLDFWGRNRAALAAARSDAEAASAEAAAARLAVSAGIASRYANLARLYVERDAAINAIQVRTSTLRLMQQRVAEGLENKGATDRARAALATARGDMAALEEAILLTRHGIAALLGAGPDRGLKITRPTINLCAEQGLPDNLPADLIGRRPDIIAARLRAEAASSRTKEAHAAFYPNISLTGLIGLQALGLNDVFKSGSEFGSVGPAISLPIFEGGQLRAKYRANEANYQAAVAQYRGALTEALREVADAASSKHALTHRLEQAIIAAKAAESAWRVANERYTGGLATYLDVLGAEDALITTKRTVATLETRAFALDVALVRALGGGFHS